MTEYLGRVFIFKIPIRPQVVFLSEYFHTDFSLADWVVVCFESDDAVNRRVANGGCFVRKVCPEVDFVPSTADPRAGVSLSLRVSNGVSAGPLCFVERCKDVRRTP